MADELCERTGKTVFTSRGAAKRYVGQWRSRGGAANIPEHPYKCKFGDGRHWHLSAKSPSVLRAILDEAR